jgi:uncharacterized protein with HEPN domain
MQRDIQKYLYDIFSSINAIEEFIGSKKDFTIYQRNRLLKRAVERELEIIGEAMNQILKLEPNIAITHARKIVDVRNFVIHGYDKVDDAIIWSIVIKYLPQLKEQVQNLFPDNTKFPLA